jgi:nicotinamide riboside kinase
MIKIAITGPESTGKSWLAKELAKHYGTTWVPEYARTYIENLNRPYNQQDILIIAQGQLSAEALEKDKAQNFLFCDTELTVCKIWSMVKYGNCDSQLIDLYKHASYDYYLLTDIDLPWEFDPQREHPNFRTELMKLYTDELHSQQKPFAIIRGMGELRLQNAIHAIERFLRTKTLL